MGLELPDLPPPMAAEFEVHPDNWSAIGMFLRLQTQWRTTMNGIVGLDYSAVEWLFRLYEVQDQRTMLEDLQTMEAAAMQAINKHGS